jgi:hypothetical protein
MEMLERNARPVRTLLLLILLLALAAAVAAAQAQDQEELPDWMPVTVLYMSDVKGKIEPCG